jgi:rhomboid family GlyGly-CTERM serine protease
MPDRMRASRVDLHDRRSGALPWPALLIGAVVATLVWTAVRDPRWHDRLDFLRDAVSDGESWRLITGHLMHLSLEHAALNLAGLALVAWIFSRELGASAQWFVCIVGAACIDAALWASQVERYVGLSGVVHAWFAAGAMRWLLASRDESMVVHGSDLAVGKRLWGAVLMIALALKLALEWEHQAFWLHGVALPVVTVAHRSGAVAGCVCGACLAWVSRRRARVGAEVHASPAR